MTKPNEALAALPRSGEMVVFDLEWTAWEGSLARNWSGPGEYCEIIQIGATRLDATVFDVLAVFERLILPVRNPVLSDYIIKFSGITNERMQAEGVSLEASLTDFKKFVGSGQLWCNGADAAVLHENCLLQNMNCPIATDKIGNLRPLFAKATGLPSLQLISCELPGLLGIESVLNRHTGIGDAMSISRALATLRKRGTL
jgi:inhibitor of KinA sporulation pathway (predicted exonuclease)